MKKTLLLGVACLMMSVSYAQEACNITNMQGSLAGGFLNWELGDEAISAFVDPADEYTVGESCGATYPYTIESVGLPVATAAVFGEPAHSGTFTYQINIYDMAGPDPCDGPGALLGSSGVVTLDITTADGLIDQMVSIDLEVNNAFFVSYAPLSWASTSDNTPSILWDNVITADCAHFFHFEGDWYDWSQVITTPGYVDFTIIGSSATGSGNNCEAGALTDDTPVTLCPDESVTFDATGVEIPAGGSYNIYFMPSADGTGGLLDTFSFTIGNLPIDIDSDLGGVLSTNSYPPLEGTWNLFGYVTDIDETPCSVTEEIRTITFLTEEDEACGGEPSEENHTCADATPVVPGIYSFEDYTPGGFSGVCDGGFFADAARWYVFTPEEDGYITVEACSGIDTRLSIFTGDCDNLSCLEFNDDSENLDCHPNGWASAIETMFVEGGVSYYIQWDNNWSDDGTSWELSFMPVPECETAEATAETSFDCDNDNFSINIDLTSLGTASSIDLVEIIDETETAVYSDVTTTGSFDFGPYSFGTTVSVMILNNDDDNALCQVDMGTFSAEGCPPENALCADAIDISCGETLSGTNEFGFLYEDNCVGNNTAPGVWYTFVGANSDNPEAEPGTTGDLVTLSTCNDADYDTKIDIYAGSCGELVCVGGNDDGEGCSGFSSEAVLFTEVGETYYVFVSGFGASSVGTFNLTMTCETAPDCYAGEIADTTPVSICIGESGVFALNDAPAVSEGYDYALFFVPTTGTGALGNEFYLTGIAVEDIPYTYDHDLGGILSGNSFPMFQGEWQIYGVVYALAGDPWETTCNQTEDFILVNFLSPADEECAPAPGEPCTNWVSPTATTGWVDFDTMFGGAPCNDGDGCPFNEITDFEVFKSEAYSMPNIQEGGVYTFSHCNGPNAGSWIPEYTIIAPSGAIDAFGEGDGDGCSITWTASEDGTYLIVINEAGNCGVAAAVPNGYPAITCNETPDCPEPNEWCDEYDGPYINFNTLFGGAPTPDSEGNCEIHTIDAFEIFASEAYLMDNIQEGVEYTFSHCEGPGAGSWIPEYTIFTPTGAVDAFGAGEDNCSISWIASESGTYIIAINEQGACGVASEVTNGYPSITCNGSVSVQETVAFDFSVFPNPNNGQFSIDFRGENGTAQIEVLSVSGKVVLSEQRTVTNNSRMEIDLGNTVSGLYFVRVTMDETSTVLKVMVN